MQKSESLSSEKLLAAQRLYLILGAIFIASLVACNLIFQKFFFWRPFEWLGWDYTFEISVGLIPYPITFLVTDLISEVFGRKKANRVVMSGVIASVFVLGIVAIADAVPATSWSPVSDDLFTSVFGLTGVAVFASMMAYLLAQFIDIRIFHFWKRLTKGKMLWLRNNFSTIPSQFIDTMMVLGLLCYFGAIEWDKFWILFLNGFLYKILAAFLDTPLFYLTAAWARKYFGLDLNEELST
ncbi:MAG: queuosine precursor transporter [Flavobacteriales bacterium]|nr:queuosine precursor transporter [Flavobacteriales bacterium]NNK80424.1 queuosine precursor transporter [Flavobacteriales bacterium]